MVMDMKVLHKCRCTGKKIKTRGCENGHVKGISAISNLSSCIMF